MSNLILDEPVPENGVPTLKPTKYIPPLSIATKNKNKGWLEWLKSFFPNLFNKTEKEGTENDNQGWVERLVHLVPNLFNQPKPNFKLVLDKESLHKSTLKYVINETNGYDPIILLKAVKEIILNKLRENPLTRARMVLSCMMVKSNPTTGEETRDIGHFSSNQETIFEETDLEDLYQKMVDKILESFANYQKNGSGWRIELINQLKFNISKSNQLKASSHIPLAKKLKDKKAIINMKNNDSKCLLWCVARALNMVDRDPERITKILQKQAEKLNCNGVYFPASFSDIDRFEKNNIPIVVLGCNNEDDVYVLRIPNKKTVKQKKTARELRKPIILLLIKDKD